ncbi:MAG: right-handed parallel beta-helix repeat-containing protein [Planctomycetota bacterium]
MFRSAWLLLLGLAATAGATDIYVNPGDDVQAIVAGIAATDDVIFNAGTYTLNHLVFSNMYGTSGDWITVRAADGATVVLQGNASFNTVDFYNAGYIHLKGFEIKNGSDGIKFNADVTASNIIIEDCYIHDITGVGINSQGLTVSNVTVQDCRITYAPTCGFYLGQSDGTGIVHHWTITHCYIAYCGDMTTGYGIEIKENSYANIIEDSVWHHVAGSSRAGIAVYATHRAAADHNVVRRNVVWNVPRYANSTTTPGIWANADARIENNIVFDSGEGFYTNANVTAVDDLVVVNNTFYNCGYIGLDENDGANCIAANNVAASCGYLDLQEKTPAQGWTNSNNMGVSAVAFASTTFGNASFLYPAAAGALVGTASATYAPGDDFNLTARPFGGTDDAGAYEWTQAGNPGWTITADFKDLSGGITDADGDGMDDTWETGHGLNPGDPTDADDDGDGDGAVNLLEFLADRDPGLADFDASTDSEPDGMPDLAEFAAFGNLAQTGGGDYDNDGYTNAAEIAAGTDPRDPFSRPASGSGGSGGGGCVVQADGDPGAAMILAGLCLMLGVLRRRPAIYNSVRQYS